jgi:methylase of polypeptide subunit release factors
VRRPVARALDLGCGGGYLALRLAAHATEVRATDVSRRALHYGALNAALNGLGSRVRFAISDRFSGLAGEVFDLITGNLPFVISPEARFVFRDAGLRSDGFLASVVRATGRHLVEGGMAQYLAQWVHRDEAADAEAEDARLAGWVHAAGCEALIIRLERDPVDAYATRWLAGPERPLSEAERARRMARWMSYYGRAGIRAISTGLFCLRRQSRGPHRFAIEDSSAASPPDGEAIASWFDAR